MMVDMAQRVWLSATQQRTWINYMQVYHRLEDEMARRVSAGTTDEWSFDHDPDIKVVS